MINGKDSVRKKDHIQKWRENVLSLKGGLDGLSVRDDTANDLEVDKAFNKWLLMTRKLRDANRIVYLVGNGASASMASHMAADLTKNGHLHTQVFTDVSLITAIANDVSYEKIFSEPLKNRMIPGDMLVAISSSGNSANIVSAVKIATELGGNVITLSAMSEGNKIRSRGQLNFYIPAQTYGMAETSHAAILHFWMDCIADALSESQN
jgi:D-sedoheptulose 7-phosphate isomerase